MQLKLQLVHADNGKVVTDSLLIAEKFGKEHRTVLRSIQTLECSEDFREHNFVLSSYKSQQNKDLPMYILTRDGFTRLVMSFTGAMAARFKEEFLAEFNRMEAIIKLERAPKKLLEVYSKRIINNEARNCPDTHWCIFTESHPVMIAVETNVGSQCEFDLIDGSIGRKWSMFRKGKTWAGEASTYEYQFADKRGSVDARCYPLQELPHFKKWLREVYKPTHLPDYLTTKYGGNAFMMKRVTAFIPKLLKAS